IGSVRPLYTETYQFHVTTDDGARLWINDVLYDNAWPADRGDTEDTTVGIPLVAGQRYAIRFEMYENGGGATARLAWSSPSQAKQIIPSSQLFPPPSITIGDLAQAEGNSGASNMVFPVSLSKSFPVPITVTYATANGSAT